MLINKYKGYYNDSEISKYHIVNDNFKQYCEKLLTKEPVGGAKRKEDFKWN